MQSYLAALKNYADFSGTTGLKEFWTFVLVNIVIGAALSLVPPVAMVYGLALLVPSIAATARRLNDIDQSPWYILLALIPVVGAVLLIFMCAQPSANASAQQASGFADMDTNPDSALKDSAFTQDNVSVSSQSASSATQNANSANSSSNQTTNV